jgi:predicted RNA binding protein YcfA (HicA-like mRNA interferase family)
LSKIPSLNYDRIIKALQRNGWVIVRQKGSHIRMQKHIGNENLKITISAHHPVKRSTLSHILKQSQIDIDKFLESL